MAYKTVCLFHVAETGTEETGSLQRCGKVLVLSKTLAGIVCAVKDKEVHLMLLLQNIVLYTLY